MTGPDATPWTDPVAVPEGQGMHARDEAPSPPLGPMHGREREYLLAVILTVLTLGVYHFYYHYKTHDELCLQLGRPNDTKPLFVAYVVLMVGVVILPVVFFLVLGGPVLLAFIVVRQYAAIQDARRRLGLMPRGDATMFLLWAYPGALILVGPFIAYYNMVHNYNEIWHALRHGAHLATDAQAGDGAGSGVPLLAETPSPYAAMPPGAPAVGSRRSEPSNGPQWAPPVDFGPALGAATSPGPAAFRVRHRHDAEPPAEGLVSQRFLCPSCETHVSVDGSPGEAIEVRCGACGETGEVQVGT